MISIEPLSTRIAAQFKTARLSALLDTPIAFGSTFAQESKLSDADWIRRVSTWNGCRSTCFVALDEDKPCGIAAGKCAEDNLQRAWLLSMWVAPGYRRSGLGVQLVDAVEGWARIQAVTHLLLMVTNVNTIAIRFYEQCGFVFTGNTAPYPNDPSLFEYEMAKPLHDAFRILPKS
jgi:GNAT superfamily N-acetyltransferase